MLSDGGLLAKRAGTPLRGRLALAADPFAGPRALKLGVTHQAATGFRRMRDLIVDFVGVAMGRLNFLRCRAQRWLLRLAVLLDLVGAASPLDAAVPQCSKIDRGRYYGFRGDARGFREWACGCTTATPIRWTRSRFNTRRIAKTQEVNASSFEPDRFFLNPNTMSHFSVLIL